MAKVYWFHGQPASGKTTHGKRLHYWLSFERRNWRRSVFFIDEEDIKKTYGVEDPLPQIETIVRYLNSTGHEVIVAVATPSAEFRDRLKKDFDLMEIYCHTLKKVGSESRLILEYDKPIQNYVDLDTTGDADKTFNNLVKMMV
jgi:adenylylsulfate kinase-like enzyme